MAYHFIVYEILFNFVCDPISSYESKKDLFGNANHSGELRRTNSSSSNKTNKKTFEFSLRK